MKRALKDILGRVTRRPGARRVAFIHIPKCAGTAVDDAIRRELGRPHEPRVNDAAARRAARLMIGGNDSARFAEGTPAYRRYLLAYHLCRGWRFISGHLPVNTDLLQEFRDQVAFVTVLREPVERWKSHYLFDKLTNREPLLQPCRTSSLSPGDELRRVLDSPLGRHLASVPTMFLAGRFPGDRDDAASLAGDVQRNLRLFAVVGFTDAMEHFEQDFHRAVGVRIRIGRKNETAAGLGPADEPLYREVVERLKQPDITAAIEQLCAVEIEIYRWAKREFIAGGAKA